MATEVRIRVIGEGDPAGVKRVEESIASAAKAAQSAGANGSGAFRQLQDAVKSTEGSVGKLTSTQLKGYDAALKVREAQAQLATAVAKYGQDSLQAERASVNLAKAQQQAAAAAQKHAEAERAAAAETTKAGDAAKGASGGLGGLLGNLAKLGVAAGAVGILAVGLSGLAGAASELIAGNAQMERYETQLTTLTGSVEGAKTELAALAKFGAETPFELPQLVEADKVLLGFGLTGENVRKKFGTDLAGLRTSIGDMAAGTGADFRELAVTWGKFASGASGEAISRLQELGIATREQLAAMGVEFSKSGQLTSPLPVALQAAMQIANEKFGGGMAKLSQTFEGKMSTLADTWSQAKRVMAAPLFDAAGRGLDVFLPMLTKLVSVLEGIPEVMARVPGPVKELAIGLGAVVLVSAALAIGLPLLGPALALVSGGFTALAGSVIAATSAMLPFIAPVTAVVAVIMALKHGHDELNASLEATFAQVQKTGGGLDQYQAATNRTLDSATGLAKVWAVMSGEDFGQGRAQKAGEAWLQYGLNVDQAVLADSKFKEASAALAIEASDQGLRKASITQEEYKRRLLEAADAASMAAGKGHVLSEAQQQVAAQFGQALGPAARYSGHISDATIQSDAFKAASKAMADQVALGNISKEAATSKLLAMGQQLDANAQKTAALAQEQAAAAGATARYSDSFKDLIAAGSEWTEDQEEMAKRQQALDQQAQGQLQGTLQKLWQSHKTYADRLKEAQQQDDADAAAAAAARARAAEQSVGKQALAEAKYADKMIGLNEKLAGAKTEQQRAAAQRDIEIAQMAHAQAEQAEAAHWNNVSGVAATGAGKREQEVRQAYEAEVQDAKVALAQTIVEWTKGQVLLGTVSQKTAESIFGNLSAAFPGVEVVRPFDEATLGIMSNLHEMADGADHDATVIRDGINNIIPAMDAIDKRSRESAQVWADQAKSKEEAEARVLASRLNGGVGIHGSLAAEDAERINSGATAIESANSKVQADAAAALAAGNRSQAVLDALGPEQVAQLDAASTAKTAAGDIDKAHALVGSSAKTAASQVGSSATGIKTSLTSVPQAATRAAGELRGASGQMSSAVSGAASQLDTARGRMSTSLAGIGQSHATTWGQVRSHVSTVAPHTQTEMDKTAQAVDRTAAPLRASATRMGEGLSVGFGDKLKEAKSKFDGWVDDLRAVDLEKVGQDILNGLTKGLRGAWDGVVERLRALVDLLPQVVRQMLGIESPSRVFAELGTAIMLGLALGIGYGGATAEAAVRQAMQDVRDAASDLTDFRAEWEQILQQALGGGGAWDKLSAMWTEGLGRRAGAIDLQALIASGVLREPDWKLLTGSPEEAKAEWQRFWNDIKSIQDEQHDRTIAHLEEEQRTTEKPWVEEMIQKQIDEENSRHAQWTANWQAEQEGAERFFEHQETYLARQQEAMQRARDALAAAQSAAEKREDLINAAVLEHIEQQARAWEKAHEQRMAELDRLKTVEDDRSRDVLAALASERKVWTDYLADQEAGVKRITDRQKELEVQLGRLKLDLGLEAEQRKLDDLQRRAADFADVLGKLETVESDPKKAAEDARKKALEKIALTTQAQRDMLRSVMGSLSGEDARTAALLMQGHALKAQEVRDLMARVAEHLQGQADAQQGVIDGKQAQIDALQRQIEQQKQLADEEGLALEREKVRVGVILQGIADRETAEKDRHDRELGRIAKLVEVENSAYEKLRQRTEDLKAAQATAHTDRMRQIAEEYAYRLASLDHTDAEIRAMTDAAARAAQEIADEAARIFGTLGDATGQASVFRGVISDTVDETQVLNANLETTTVILGNAAAAAGAVAAHIGSAAISLHDFGKELRFIGDMSEKALGGDGSGYTRTPNFSGRQYNAKTGEETGAFRFGFWPGKPIASMGDLVEPAPGAGGSRPGTGPFGSIISGSLEASKALNDNLVAPMKATYEWAIKIGEALNGMPAPPPGSIPAPGPITPITTGVGGPGGLVVSPVVNVTINPAPLPITINQQNTTNIVVADQTVQRVYERAQQLQAKELALKVSHT